MVVLLNKETREWECLTLNSDPKRYIQDAFATKKYSIVKYAEILGEYIEGDKII